MIAVDCEPKLRQAVCDTCKRTAVGAHVWISDYIRRYLLLRFCCRNCIKKISQTKDLALWKSLWRTDKQYSYFKRTLKELEDLMQRYPKRRFFKILYLIVKIRVVSHTTMVQAIHRLWLGKQPTRRQYKFLTETIKGYIRARTKHRKAFGIHTRGYGEIYTGAGSCGFL